METALLQGEAKEVTKYCKGFKYFRISRSRQAFGLATNLIGSLPYQVRYFYDKKIKAQIESEIEQIKPDVVFCQLVRMAPYTKHLDYPIVIDYMDAFSLIMKRRHQNANGFFKRWFYKLEAKRLEKYERTIEDRYAAKIIISQEDKQALQAVHDLVVISNGVDSTYYQPKEKEKVYDILFAGNMGYAPNVSAAKYLIKEIVKDQSMSVLIAGARPQYDVEQLASESVKVSGWMKDIRDAYYQSKIFVAPLFEGAGQQNKILQAMAMGIPCITTPMVNASIGAEANREILIASDPNEFNKHIKQLLEHPEIGESMANKARKFVASGYSWEEQNQKLKSQILALL